MPFITVFWMPDKKYAEENKCDSPGGWDTHGNNFHCLKNHLLPKFDRAFSALIEDLSNRGLLDSTLVYITSEMGEHPGSVTRVRVDLPGLVAITGKIA